MEIIKISKAEIAHKLSKSYTCKCRNIHGHSYKFHFHFKAQGLNEEGVIIDFTKIKEIISPLINLWDHSLLVHKEDSLIKEIKDLGLKGQKVGVCSFNPTAENMALFLGLSFHKSLESLRDKRIITEDILLSEVKVFETDTGSASALKEDFCNLKEEDFVIDYYSSNIEKV